MSSMAYVTFLIVTAIAMCGVVESAPRPKDTAINEVVKNIDFVNEDNGTLGKPEETSVEGNSEVTAQETNTVVCPPGYEAVEVFCYKINLQLGDFQQHKDLCFQSGGYLISIETKEESDALIEYMRRLNLNKSHEGYLYIGLVDMYWGDQRFLSWMYTWTLPYENWAPGHPSSSMHRECGVVEIFGEHYGKWRIQYCKQLRGGICEANPLAKLSLANQ